MRNIIQIHRLCGVFVVKYTPNGSFSGNSTTYDIARNDNSLYFLFIMLLDAELREKLSKTEGHSEIFSNDVIKQLTPNVKDTNMKRAKPVTRKATTKKTTKQFGVRRAITLMTSGNRVEVKARTKSSPQRGEVLTARKMSSGDGHNIYYKAQNSNWRKLCSLDEFKASNKSAKFIQSN